MRKILASALAASLAASGASAAPLAPGKPAGLRPAQYYYDNTPLILLGVAAIAVGIALAASDHHHHDGRDGHDGGGGNSSTGTR